MKNALQHKILIYDDACPLCEWYSNAFIKMGWMQASSRKPFSQIDEALQQSVDLERACNEIPLIDTQTKTVVYGIDAMVEILNSKLPFVKPIASISPVNWFLRKLYKLISYNRKGIVAKVPKGMGFSCTPSYSFSYKKIFITFCFTIASLIVYTLFKKTFPVACDIVLGISALISIIAIVVQNKNYLEFAMQWQLQLMIICVLLIPAALLGMYTPLGAMLYTAVMCFLFIKLIVQRIVYLQYYFKTDK
jgi:predicted DCC family thiol-disulfide oxidoreductase YuxK